MYPVLKIEILREHIIPSEHIYIRRIIKRNCPQKIRVDSLNIKTYLHAVIFKSIRVKVKSDLRAGMA